MKKIILVAALLFGLGSVFRIQGSTDPSALGWAVCLLAIAMLLPENK
jgi:hypothetical protein